MESLLSLFYTEIDSAFLSIADILLWTSYPRGMHISEVRNLYLYWIVPAPGHFPLAPSRDNFDWTGFSYAEDMLHFDLPHAMQMDTLASRLHLSQQIRINININHEA